MSMTTYRPRFVSRVQRGRNWIPKDVRAEIYNRDKFICQYCNKIFDKKKLTIEHIVPVSKGGIDDISNYITACMHCNSSKRDMLISDFIVKRWDIQISNLPIHGDVIMDTPELDKEYRHTRRMAYYQMRERNQLKGAGALKKLEKMFRSMLWKTAYGRVLALRYPELPGQVRVSIPLVEYLVPDTRKAVHRLLVEFCKSGQTRAMIDDMVRIVSNWEYEKSIDSVIKSVVYGTYDEILEKKIHQAFKRANIRPRDASIFCIEKEYERIPVAERDLLVAKVEFETCDFGITFIDDYEVRVPLGYQGKEIEILITKVTPNYAVGKIAVLPIGFED